MPVVVVFNKKAQRTEHGGGNGSVVEDRETVVKELYGRFVSSLQTPKGRDNLTDILGTRLRKTLNVGRDKHGQDVWKEGTIRNFEITPAGEFNADHEIELYNGTKAEFTIDGRITVNPNNNNEYQITWRGRKRFTTVAEENYQVMIIARNRGEMKNGPLYGRWQGRISAETDNYTEGMGFFVLVPSDWNGDLATLEGECEKRIGGLTWCRPEAEKAAKQVAKKSATKGRTTKRTRRRTTPPPKKTA